MSLSSYLKRQSRIRKSVASAPLTSIVEEPVSTDELGLKPMSMKIQSVKSKRRRGVSDLRIPSFTAPGLVVAIPAFDAHEEAESSGSSSGSESFGSSGSSSGNTSPTSSNVPTTPTSPAANTEKLIEEEDDDEYYAAHASNFVTLAPSLDSISICSFESTTIDPRSSLHEYVPTYCACARAPPPPSLVTSHSSSSSASASVPAVSRPRPPPRTPVPTDTRSGDYSSYSPGSSPTSVDSPSSSPASSSSSSSSRLDSLLSPPPAPARTSCVPEDVDGDEGCWEDLDLDLELEQHQHQHDEYDGYEDVPLSALLVPAPSSVSSTSSTPSPPSPNASDPGSSPSPDVLQDAGKQWTFPPSPLAPPSITVDDRTPAPALRSRWSSSTLSSLHSAHAPRSPKSFAFARRYLSLKSPNTKLETFSAPPSAFVPALKRAARGKGKNRKKLTVADVLVVRPPPCSPPPVPTTPTPTTPPSAQWAAYPASLSLTPPVPSTPSTASPALYAAYMTQRSPRRHASTSSSNVSLAGWTGDTSESDSDLHSPYSLYTPAPARGSHSAWSSAGSVLSAEGSGSDAGHSECSAGSTSGSGSGSGLKRKPIPVEMFLRL
ncbi:hypothetical protein C8R43DRAFT_1108135 [Mycena crocata]|nr:hypothetical protein C8R43DRAFT_1108135 [Mycena crocata]